MKELELYILMYFTARTTIYNWPFENRCFEETNVKKSWEKSIFLFYSSVDVIYVFDSKYN